MKKLLFVISINCILFSIAMDEYDPNTKKSMEEQAKELADQFSLGELRTRGSSKNFALHMIKNRIKNLHMHNQYLNENCNVKDNVKDKDDVDLFLLNAKEEESDLTQEAAIIARAYKLKKIELEEIAMK